MRILVMPLASLALASCVPQVAAQAPVSAPPPQVRPPQPRPTPRPVTQTPPAPTPAASTVAPWADAPLTPGSWSYRRSVGESSRALFGPPGAASFQVACETGRQVSLFRPGAGQGTLTIRTSSTARTLQGTSQAERGLGVQLSANDPLLDSIAFSRGRFAVEAPGVPPLVIPAWPEFARVLEDCRR